MKKFGSLLKREHMINGTHSYAVLALLVVAILFIPIGLEQYNAKYREEEVRFLIVIAGAIGISINAVFMVVASINRDVKIKELWLHSTQPIYRLIGAKVVYQFVVLLLLGVVNFAGLFFVGEIVKGTWQQFFVLACVYFYLLVGCFFLFVVFTIFANSLIKQLVVWTGKIGNFIGFIGLVAFISVGDVLPSLSFLEIGLVEIPNIESYLPKFNDASISIQAYSYFYIVEEIVLIAFFVGMYALACKWLERVITR